jgi:hypothetical protein
MFTGLPDKVLIKVEEELSEEAQAAKLAEEEKA